MQEVTRGTRTEWNELDPLENLLTEVQFFAAEVKQYHRKNIGDKHICRGTNQEAINVHKLIKGFVI